MKGDRKVRVTQDPHREITVSQQEYTDLERQGLLIPEKNQDKPEPVEVAPEQLAERFEATFADADPEPAPAAEPVELPVDDSAPEPADEPQPEPDPAPPVQQEEQPEPTGRKARAARRGAPTDEIKEG